MNADPAVPDAASPEAHPPHEPHTVHAPRAPREHCGPHEAHEAPEAGQAQETGEPHEPREAHEAQASAHAAAELRARIADGKLPPGAKLSEQSVASELGVSRNTLRESFAMLASQRLVDRIPFRGVFVIEPSPEDVRDLYAARLVLEPGALLWGEVDGPVLDRLRETVAAALAAESAGDVPGMADANQRFHRELLATAGSRALLQDMDRALARMRLVFHAKAADQGFHARYAHRNAEVLTALEADDRDRAVDLLRHALADARDELLEQLGAGGTARAAQGTW